MTNPDDYKDFSILGSNVQVILDGFGSFTLLASKILLDSGLGKMDNEGIGMAVIEPQKWYPLDAFLRAFERIGGEFGDFTLRQSGIHINKVASDPGAVTTRDIASAFTFLDQGYHFNHGKDGKPMFNPQTGEMVEGIGHFKSRQNPANPKSVYCDIDSVYPCAFNEGIVVGLAQRFDPKAKVVHDLKSCRKRGAAVCTYTITWNK